jgi:hypothetical protein
MPHVFVESNWLFAYAAPAHHKIPAAVELLDRARRGEFTLHMPNVCIAEARKAITEKCKPRREADAIRRFVSWSETAKVLAEADAATVRNTLLKYESSVKRDLDRLDVGFRKLSRLPYLRIFGLDDEMLGRAISLSLAGLDLKPFDQAILASVLVASKRLWSAGERGISFCEGDSDLQPWDKNGRVKPALTAEYDKAHVWVYGDFTLVQPPRAKNFR